MSNIHHLKLVVKGGMPVPPAILAPRVSPFRMPPKKVSDVVQDTTKTWKGVRVPVDIEIDTSTMPPKVSCKIEVSASSLILKALNEPFPRPKGAPHDGAVDFAEIQNIAAKLRHKSFCQTFTKMVTQVLGTARSIGCNIRVAGELRTPAEVCDMISAGELSCTEPDQ